MTREKYTNEQTACIPMWLRAFSNRTSPVLLDANIERAERKKTSTTFVLLHNVNMFQTWLDKQTLKKIQAQVFTAFAFARKAAANRSISALSESLSKSWILSNASLGLVGVQGSVLELDPPDLLCVSCSTMEAFITMICIKSVISVAWAFAFKRFAIRMAFFLSFANVFMFFFSSFFEHSTSRNAFVQPTTPQPFSCVLFFPWLKLLLVPCWNWAGSL